MTADRTLCEAKAKHKQTAFLCHSHLDKTLANGLQILLNEHGWDLYVDWQDTAMPEKPTRETAIKIQEKIKGIDWFLFLATPNSVSSKWCPWEIGFADNSKPHNKIFIIPTTDYSGIWYGNEYLQLYRRIDLASNGILAAFDEGKTSDGIYIRNL
jgi:hypothetical protein